MTTMQQKIRDLHDKCFLSRNAIAKVLGVANVTVTRWLSPVGTVSPMDHVSMQVASRLERIDAANEDGALFRDLADIPHRQRVNRLMEIVSGR